MIDKVGDKYVSIYFPEKYDTLKEAQKQLGRLIYSGKLAVSFCMKRPTEKPSEERSTNG